MLRSNSCVTFLSITRVPIIIFNSNWKARAYKVYDERKPTRLLLSSRHLKMSLETPCGVESIYRAVCTARISKYRHYSCMRSKCTKFSHGAGGHVGDTRGPAQRCVLCLFLAETCHMLLVPPFLVKSNGDTEVSPERQRFVNNSRAQPFEIPFEIHWRFPRRSFNSFARCSIHFASCY